MPASSASLGTLSVFLGVILPISGVADLVIFAKTRNDVGGAGWILADGILTVILSLFLLFHQMLVVSSPVIFGMWLIFSGVSKMIISFDLKTAGARGWGWFPFLESCSRSAASSRFVKPVAAAVALGVLIGITLIIHGIIVVVKGFLADRLFLSAAMRVNAPCFQNARGLSAPNGSLAVLYATVSPCRTAGRGIYKLCHAPSAPARLPIPKPQNQSLPSILIRRPLPSGSIAAFPASFRGSNFHYCHYNTHFFPKQTSICTLFHFHYSAWIDNYLPIQYNRNMENTGI